MAETLDIPSDPSQEIVIAADGLEALMVRMLTHKGMYEAEARIGAARLIEADLRGIHSHGSRSLWRYLEAMDTGGIDPRAQIITEREERASVAIGTNLPFSEWGTVFPDPRLVAAIVDRVTFNAHILETGTQSYRLRTSKTASRTRKPS